MTHHILERLVLSTGFLIVFVAIAKTLLAVNRRRILSGSLNESLASIAAADKPTLMYFWTPSCGQCKPQERAIEQVKAALQQFGRSLAVHKVNAFEDPELAKSMHVITVPTTVLLDVHGNITAWNAGFAPAQTILDQVKRA